MSIAKQSRATIAAAVIAALVGAATVGIATQDAEAAMAVSGPLVPGEDLYDRYVLTVDMENVLAEVAADAAGATATGASLSEAERVAADELITHLRSHGIAAEALPRSGSVAPAPAAVEVVDAAVDAREALAAAVDRVAAVPGVVSARGVLGGLVSVTAERGLPTAALTSVPGITDVEDDHAGWASSNDPHYGIEWGLENTGQSINGTTGTPGADIGWKHVDRVVTGAGVTVAVIDSGFDLDHPDLSGIWAGNADEICGNGVDDDANGYVDDCLGWDFFNGDAQVDDSHTQDHGTHVAGTIAAKTGNGVGIAGVAPDVKIIPLKIMENDTFPMVNGAEAIRYAVDNGADVINASWGSAPGTPLGSQMASALAYAEAAGVLIAAASGNDGVDIDASPTYPAAGNYANIISVGAHTNRDARASFSNYGQVNVDVYAPGELIVSTVDAGGYMYYSGTSMAAPHVAGLAALSLSAEPGQTGAMLRQRIMDTSVVVAGLSQSVTSARVNAPALLGIDPNAEDMAVHVTGAETYTTGELLTLDVTLPKIDTLPASTQLRATLATSYDGQVYGVVEQPVLAGRAGAANQRTTDADAQVDLSGALSATDRQNLSSGQLSLALGGTLPDGEYFVLVEAYNADDPMQTFDRASVVAFRVGEAPAPEPEPTTDPTTEPTTSPTTETTTEPTTSPTTEPTTEPTTSPTTETTTSPTTEPTTEPTTSPTTEPTTEPTTSPTTETTTEPTTEPTTSPTTEPTTSPTTEPTTEPTTSPTTEPTTEPTTSPTTETTTEPTTSPTTEPTTEPTTSPTTETTTETTTGTESGPVWPTSGSTSGGESVRVRSTDPLPDRFYVKFGSRNATIVSTMTSTVTVAAPSHVAGTVDVTITDPNGNVIDAYLEAYTYVSDSGSTEPTTETTTEPTTSPTTDTTTETTTSPTTEPTTEPTTSPTTETTTETTTSPTTETTTSTEPAPTTRTARNPFTAPSGLKLDAFNSGHPLAAMSSTTKTQASCSSSPCLAVRL